MFWGYTPALDLNKELDISTQNQTVNILLLGTADGRHVIKTLAESYKHKNIKYNFYVAETWTEQIARQLLFLNIILDQDSSLGIYDKVRIFMELYGNIKIRPSVARYLYKKSADLVEAITDSTYLSKKMPIFNFSQLNTKDRDYMENVFKFWKRPDSQFGIQAAWDFRVRKALGQRFECRNEVFDFDYRTRLYEQNLKIISACEYMDWRESGIAFKWSKLDESKPNLTYGTGVLGSGLKLLYHGYSGDIVTGPHIAYGIECDDEKMFEKSNGVFIKRSTDITEYNLFQMFHQIIYDKPCDYNTYSKDLKTGLYEDFDAKKYDPIDATPLMPKNHFTVTFLSVSNLPNLSKKYLNYFDLMVFGNDQLHRVEKDLLATGQKHAKILFETQKFMIQLKIDSIREYGELIALKNLIGLVPLKEIDPFKDAYAKFRKIF